MVLSDLDICLPHQQQWFPYICSSWCLLRRLEAGDILAIIHLPEFQGLRVFTCLTGQY
ncbi:hypothetical protein [Nostoc sp. FACHB-152]|uniref:hypothetical protein n=1 Tax=Nostoc sp. FACHB-152 TaxID=2692837 RepID=UPI001F559CC0|nr:hypothetical protein [Nostoc sp. FACHB-152]